MTITYSRSNFATFSTIEKAFAVRRPYAVQACSNHKQLRGYKNKTNRCWIKRSRFYRSFSFPTIKEVKKRQW